MPCIDGRYSAGGGGTGGGACCAGALYAGCGCLERTGGSFAKTFRKSARKLNKVDLSQYFAHCAR